MGLLLTLIYIGFCFLSVPAMVPSLAPYRIQLITAAAATLASVPLLLRDHSPIANMPAALMAVFTMIITLSWLPHGWMGGAVRALTDFAPAGLVLFLVAINCRSLARLRALRFLLVAITLYMLGRGLWEYRHASGELPYVMWQRVETSGAGEDGPVGLPRLRGLGVLADPNDYAQYLLTLIPFLFVTLRPGWRRLGVLLSLPILALFLYGVYLSHSRGAILGLAALVGFAIAGRMSRLGAGLTSAAVAAGLVALNFAGGREVSIGGGADRLNIWSDGLGLFKSSPIWGIGFHSFADEVSLTAHNSFLLCATELGLVGYFFFMALLVVSFGQLLRVQAARPGDSEPQPELQRWARATWLSLCTFLVTSFFLSRLYEPLVYLLLGMALAVSLIDAEDRGEQLVAAPTRWASVSAALCVGSIALIYVLVRLRVA